MLLPDTELDIQDIEVGHIDAYVVCDKQNITFSVNNNGIHQILNQIGYGNFVDSLGEFSEVLNFMHPDSILDYLAVNYSPDELRKHLEKNIKIAEEHNATCDYTFESFEKWVLKANEFEEQELRNRYRKRDSRTLRVPFEREEETIEKYIKNGYEMEVQNKDFRDRMITLQFVKYLNNNDED